MSDGTSPGSLGASAATDSPPPAPPPHPIIQACNRIFDAFKADNPCGALQAFDELQGLSLEEHDEFRADVLRAWGRAIQCAASMSGGDEEHMEEMIDDYEERFQVPAAWQLRALLLHAPTASGALEELLAVLEQRHGEDHRTLQAYLEETNRVNKTPVMVEDGAEADTARPSSEGSEVKERVLQRVYDGLDGILEKYRLMTCAEACAIRETLLRLFGERPRVVVTAASSLARRDRRARDAGALEDEEAAATEDTPSPSTPTVADAPEPPAPQLDIPEAIVAKLQRPYIARMKTEDPELVLEEMVRDGLKPVNVFPYTFIFMKPTLSKPIMTGHYIDMLMFGVKPQKSLYRILLRSPLLTKDEHYFLKRRIVEKREMEDFYDRMLRNKHYSNPLDAATKLFKCMELDNVPPDRHAFNFIISCCRGQPVVAEEWYRKMIDQGVQPNAATFSHLLSIWKDSARYADSAEKWIQEMGRRDMQIDSHHYASLLDTYVRSNSRQRAQGCFKALLVRGECSVPVYNSVMKLGPFDWALGCLACLLSDGLQPSPHTRSTLQNQARDTISESIVEELCNCQWHKDAILTNATLVNPARGTTPSLQDCMRLMMREMKMSDDEMKRRLEKLSAEMDLAKRAR